MLKRVQYDVTLSLRAFVIPNQVLNLIQDLRFPDLTIGFENLGLNPGDVGRILSFTRDLHDCSIPLC